MIQPSGSQSRAQEKRHSLNKEVLLATGSKGADGGRGQSLLPARSLRSQDAGEGVTLGQLSVRLDTYTPGSALCHR